MAEQTSGEAASAGLLAIVFTDVERSTELWQIDEDAFGWALMEHDHEVRETLQRYGGTEVKHTGDGFFLVFETVAGGARFCLDLQTRLTDHDWPPELGPVRTRMGMHFGRALRFGTDYRGSAVNLASRVCAASQGGQVLLPGDAANELQSDHEMTARLLERGQFELSGITERIALFELACDATRHIEFGPVRQNPPPPAAVRPVESPMPDPARFSAEDRAAWSRAAEALRRSDHEAAVAELLALVESHPDDVPALTTLGVAFAWGEQYERAEHCLRKAVEIDEQHASAWFNLARVYGKTGRRDQIGHALAMALRADPSHAKARAVAAKYGVIIPDLPQTA